MPRFPINHNPDRNVIGQTTPAERAILMPRFLDLIGKGVPTGAAALKMGLSRQTVYNWRKAYPDFAQAWADALQESVERMEVEADRRAIEGVDKPVFYQGVEVGTIKEYSDTLLIFRLKALDPRYRDRITAPTLPPGMGANDIDLRNLTTEELAQFESLIMKAASGPPVPVEENVIEGESKLIPNVEDPIIDGEPEQS